MQMRLCLTTLVATSLESGSNTLTFRLKIEVTAHFVPECSYPATLPALDDEVAANGVFLDREGDERVGCQSRTAAIGDDVPTDRVSCQVHRQRLIADDITAHRVVRREAVAGSLVEGAARASPGLQPSPKVAPLPTMTLPPTWTVATTKGVQTGARCNGQVAGHGQHRTAVDVVVPSDRQVVILAGYGPSHHRQDTPALPPDRQQQEPSRGRPPA